MFGRLWLFVCADSYMAEREQKLSTYLTQCRNDTFYYHDLLTIVSSMQLASTSQKTNTICSRNLGEGTISSWRDVKEIQWLICSIFLVFRVSYQALYSYTPQNDDELELRDGDIVDVMEKCDDGWFVGEYDTCLSAELFRMSSFAECLEVSFICGVTIVEKKNFHNFLFFSHQEY